MNYLISDNLLTLLRTGSVVSFPWPVGDVLEFNEIFVVRLEPEPGSCFNENVFGVTPNGTVAWVMAKRKHVYDDSPYTSALKKDSLVKLFNWDGEELVIDPKSGEVLSEGYGR